MRVALIQFNANANKEDNIRRASAFVVEAAKEKARFILLPEVFTWRGDMSTDAKFSAAENIPGPLTQHFAKIAIEHGVHILLGSFLEQSSDPKRLYNTSVLLNPQGAVIAKYRKIHLFDAKLGCNIIREADTFLSGTEGAVASVDEFKVGLSICYDVRFPDLYWNYGHAQGVNVITVPSCFTAKTGQAHWESLLKARAIENLAYVLAPNQIGEDYRGVKTYGHSMIISPWGEMLAQGSAEREEIIYADIDLERIKEAREQLPGIIDSRLRGNDKHS